MKKLMMLSAAILVFSSAPAMAESGESDDKAGMFSKHDTDGDGTISKDEFLNHAEERFSKIDSDGDGAVSKEEAKAGHQMRRSEMKERMRERRENRQNMRMGGSE